MRLQFGPHTLIYSDAALPFSSKAVKNAESFSRTIKKERVYDTYNKTHNEAR